MSIQLSGNEYIDSHFCDNDCALDNRKWQSKGNLQSNQAIGPAPYQSKCLEPHRHNLQVTKCLNSSNSSHHRSGETRLHHEQNARVIFSSQREYFGILKVPLDLVNYRKEANKSSPQNQSDFQASNVKQ